MKEGKALVLLSGGIDSTTCLMLARRDCAEVETISFLYGQKHSREVDSAAQISARFDFLHHQIPLPQIFGGQGSTLTDADKEQPHKTYQQLMESEGPSPTVVPFRNANLLSAATVIALRQHCDWVYWAPHATDAHHHAYPDCEAEFAGAMANAIYHGTYRKVRLVTPLQWLTKVEVVELGLKLQAPLDLTWSCYEGGEKQCGWCPTCVERLEAFRLNNVIDPVPYRNEYIWPSTCKPYQEFAGVH